MLILQTHSQLDLISESASPQHDAAITVSNSEEDMFRFGANRELSSVGRSPKMTENSESDFPGRGLETVLMPYSLKKNYFANANYRTLTCSSIHN